MFGRKHFAPEGEGAGGGGSAAPVVPAAAPVAAPVAAPAAAVAPPVAPAAAPVAAVDPTTDPVWIKARLEREAATTRTRVLAELGITDVATAKVALATAATAAEANKSAELRAVEAAGQLASTRAENQRLAAITQEHAGRMIGVLTVEQQAAIRALAPDTDPAGQLQAIGVLGPTWAAAANVAAASAAAAPPAAGAPAPASTAPGATAPIGGPTASPPDHKSVYTASRAKNPFAAAAYGLEHASEVYRSKA